MRTAQFSEDAGPMAHPIRPDSYIKMDNFYTVTVYEKVRCVCVWGGGATWAVGRLRELWVGRSRSATASVAALVFFAAGVRGRAARETRRPRFASLPLQNKRTPS